MNIFRYTISLISFLLFFSCGNPVKSVAIIKISGSETMLPLTEKLAEEYMIKNPSISIYVEGGGTEYGIKSVLNSTADICMASRALEPEEIKQISTKFGSVGLSFLVAKDALSIYLNKSNPVNNLSIEQIKKIYLGEIINWKDIGGENSSILAVMRAPNSGTHLYFKQHILEGKNYTEKAVIKLSFQSVIENVNQNKDAIGYGGIEFSDKVKTSLIDGVTATEDNIKNNTYPLTRYLYFHTPRDPQGAVKEFIDWVISQEGQKIITNSGYFSIWRNSF